MLPRGAMVPAARLLIIIMAAGMLPFLLLKPKMLGTVINRAEANIQDIKSTHSFLNESIDELSKTRPVSNTREHLVNFAGVEVPVLSHRITGSTEGMESDVTIVTGFFDLGYIPAGPYSTSKEKSNYYKWFSIFTSVMNPVVFFTDDEKAVSEFITARGSLATQVFVVAQDSLWAFQLRENITLIYNDPDYPKHIPNTVYPAYTLVTHAKFEVTHMASNYDFYGSPIICWLDIGLYREDVYKKNDTRLFVIRPLPSFRTDKIAFNEIRAPNDHWSIEYIMKGAVSWYCGCFFMATREKMLQFTADYKKHVEILLSQRLSSCEEQVLAAMYLKHSPFSPVVPIQSYRAKPNLDPWYSLGQETRLAGLIK